MKRSILALSCMLFLSSLGAVCVSAQSPQGAGVEGKKVKSHWRWWHHEKHKKKDKTPPLYSTPKSVGWWHHRGPGPAGAGTK
jgi:hypothetical protein